MSGKMILFLAGILFAAAAWAEDVKGVPVKGKNGEIEAIRFDFQKTVLDEDGYPAGWTYKGKFRTPDVRYVIEKDPELGHPVLVIQSPKATGVIMADISGIDLAKYPIMRWRWKALQLPAGADARVKAKDDQGIAIYVGYGRFRQTSCSYTWETVTPKNLTGKAVYNGLVTVHWRSLRNQEDKLNTWYTEEVNLYQDLKEKLGKVPDGLALSISSNSQYTGTDAKAMIDYIEFCRTK